MIDFILGFVVGSLLTGLAYRKVRRMMEEGCVDSLIRENVRLQARLAEYGDPWWKK